MQKFRRIFRVSLFLTCSGLSNQYMVSLHWPFKCYIDKVYALLFENPLYTCKLVSCSCFLLLVLIFFSSNLWHLMFLLCSFIISLPFLSHSSPKLIQVCIDCCGIYFLVIFGFSYYAIDKTEVIVFCVIELVHRPQCKVFLLQHWEEFNA